MTSKQIRWGLASSAAIVVLILDSHTALIGAKEGIELCLGSLIPSLFPFFILTFLLTGSLLGTRLPLLRLPAKAAGIPQGCESLLIPAFLGGYPAGAQCIAQAYSRRHISEDSAKRALLFCNNPGPSFLFGILTPFFPDKRCLWALWGIQIGAALVWGWILPPCEEKEGVIAPGEVSITKAVSTAIRSMASVCGWVILFRVLIVFAQRWFLWMVSPWLQVVLTGVLELSNGCTSLAMIQDIRLRFVICAGLLSFGGLCVTMQTASMIQRFSMRPYVFSKLAQSLLCVWIAAAMVRKQLWMLLFSAVFCLCLKKTVAFRATVLYNGVINQRRNPYAVSKENGARLRLLPERRTAGRGSDPLHQKRSAQSR